MAKSLDAQEEEKFIQIMKVLDAKWPESKIEPSLDRIKALVDILGSPQDTFRSIHIAGTNGKTSTSRMIDSLLQAFELRTGRFTSPHLETPLERISLNGTPITPTFFNYTYTDIASYIDLIDQRSDSNGIPLSYFEVMTAIAFAAFADAPIDVAVLEAGMGGEWDATNVVSSDVAVMMPIGLDHQEYLGETIAEIAETKAGIFESGKPVVMAHQEMEAAQVLMRKAAEMEAIPLREGLDFGIEKRSLAIGGQLLTIQGIGGTYEDIFLPLHGRHQGSNAAVALITIEAFLGGGSNALDSDVIREGFANASSPGRLEIMRRNPTVMIDAAHNAHGAIALSQALAEEFTFDRVIAVVAILGDKDVVKFLNELSKVADEIIVTRNSSPRAMPIEDLKRIAVDIFEEGAVSAAPSIAAAIQEAVEKASQPNVSIGVVVTGSVVTAGAARALLKRDK
ncbi:MAG: bifunctional folylpolyglutamate synthase/dihydrofolate synthase [Candidatus Nanopelagicaceae bacterium]|nr:bifunctional folylpolyglutamate synthase/dihydrofolate synthase [Candidatus Nanopelagicaceae bacterium]